MSKSLFLCLAICKTVFGLAGNDLGSDDVKLDVEWLEASSDCHNLPTNATRQQSHTINPRIGDMSWALSKTSDYDKAPNEARVVCHLQFALQNVLKARGKARAASILKAYIEKGEFPQHDIEPAQGTVMLGAVKGVSTAAIRKPLFIDAHGTPEEEHNAWVSSTESSPDMPHQSPPVAGGADSPATEGQEGQEQAGLPPRRSPAAERERRGSGESAPRRPGRDGSRGRSEWDSYRDRDRGRYSEGHRARDRDRRRRSSSRSRESYERRRWGGREWRDRSWRSRSRGDRGDRDRDRGRDYRHRDFRSRSRSRSR
ncbi:hypothetical protein EMIHUDRAFT_449854 [Emiliania huxleyi CCMP1516]|uniref:Uncharacterized protein n=2 Tax=Emiliania huxleyi TaxID=2903 RepID=A0A0D3K0K7_EMIH1|nr:hypothetical protein EMIHUDRAFT_449854 [Emiliania huxleyi CCMP1516]EOD29292.1 hypothetical protein EMIHUDRAFT_449854 [Emiliania huxleyi CCMP1516]|eukprot:XP_005781721.1 hypothetical protein EMIHUDRAFT_449854 [Emiliania huxleyi CCMP1516]